MPYRKTFFANNYIYHIVNQSVAQISIYKSIWDYRRIIDVIDFYRYSQLPLSYSHFQRLPKESRNNFITNKKKHKTIVKIIAFCLMPNHYHFLLQQMENKGISTFMRNMQNSYARYFNTKYERMGGLFQSMFKAIRIESNEQLLHVSRYIHLNPVSAYLTEIEELDNYPWSSFGAYMNQFKYKFISPKIILSFFKNTNAYRKFVFDQASYQRELQTIKHLALEKH